jgi:hypothetical protein
VIDTVFLYKGVFMKKTNKVLGIIAFLAIMGFAALSFTGCDDPLDNKEKEKIPEGQTSVNATQLTIDTWADGNIPAGSGEQWFKFTAVQDTQYIHFEPGSMFLGSIQLYENDDVTEKGGEKDIGGAASFSYELSSGLVYYIKITGSANSALTTGTSGTYKIAFTSASTPPAITLPEATQITAGTWTDFDIVNPGEKWFKFTATAAAQYIHFEVDSLALYIQLYITGGNTVGESIKLSSLTGMSTPITVTDGTEYYIRVTDINTGGANKIGLTLTSSPPAMPGTTLPTENVTTLTADTLTAGNIATTDGEQWFKFTATAASQFIIFKPGVLNDVYVQLYDSAGTQVGNKTELYKTSSKSSVILYTFRAVTSGDVYYIKVTPYSSSDTGAYQIMFSDSFIPKGTNIIELTAKLWSDGNIFIPNGLTNDDVEQWFKFTASANTKFVHIDDYYYKIQLYDNHGTAVGEENTSTYDIKYFSMSVTNGEVYYIRVKKSGALVTGRDIKYRIGVTESASVQPGIILPTANITQLTANKMTERDIRTDDVRWYKFTATATTQYIHLIMSDSYATKTIGQLYENIGVANIGVAVGEEITWWNSSSTVESRPVVIGKEYYLKVTPSYNDGIYMIGFNATEGTPPGFTVPASGITNITPMNSWRNIGNLAVDGEQWFSFTANPNQDGDQYIHFRAGTLAQVYFVLCTANGTVVEGNTFNNFVMKMDSTSTWNYYISRPVTSGTVYYLRVTPYNDGSNKGSGTYSIAYNTSSIKPN